MDRYKVMIVEDQTLPRKLFEILLSNTEHYELAVSLENADFADIYCLKNHVDLILMDVITQNGANGLKAAENIKKNYPEIKIIIVTSMPEYSYINRAREIGVEGFWYKEISDDSIIGIMDEVMSGCYVFPDDTPNIRFGSVTSHNLTKRELDVLKEMTGGYTNAEISEHLNVSLSTVKKHIESMLEKTKFRNRTELAVKAREVGLVILD